MNTTMLSRKICLTVLLLVTIFTALPSTMAILGSKTIPASGKIGITEEYAFKAVKLYGSEEVDGSYGTWGDILDQLKANNVNTIEVEIIDWNGYIKWIPRVKYWSGAKYGVQNWGGDILPNLINEAHARGIKIWVWTSVLGGIRVYNSYPDIRQINDDGTPAEYMICPLTDYVDEHVKRALDELLHEYNVDGISLDHLRFECTSHQSGFHPLCKASFENWLGRSITWPDDVAIYNGPYLEDFRNWKREVIFNVTKDLVDYIHSIDPNMPVMLHTVATKGTISSEGTWGADYGLYGQDYNTLADILDAVEPMMYSFADNPDYMSAATILIKNTIGDRCDFVPALNARKELASQLDALIPSGINGAAIAFYLYPELHTQWNTVKTYYGDDSNFLPARL